LASKEEPGRFRRLPSVIAAQVGEAPCFSNKRTMEFFAHRLIDCARISEKIPCLKEQYFHIA
jgi:hypothetical protein